MKRIISVIIALLCVSPAYAQVDISVSPAGSHSGSSVGGGSPSGPQPTPYRPSVSTPRDRSDDYESFCISDHAGTCNFMKRDTLGHWIDREELYTRSALVDKQRELASKEAALDKDLAALRSGASTSGSGGGLGTAASSFGAEIQAKIDATAASKVRTAELGASREKILVEASAAHRAAIDQAVAAADEAISESEVGRATVSIEKSVGSHYLQERLDREYRRADTVEMRIRAEGGPHERDRLLLASDGRYALDSARSNLEMGLLERSHYALKLGTRLLDVAIDFAPLMIAVAAPHAVVAVGVAMTLSFAKDYYEARTGRRLLGGEMLTGSERSMAMVGAVLAMAPVVGPSYKALAAASESLAIFAEVSKAAKVEARAGSAVAGELAGLDEAVNGASRVLDGAKEIGFDPRKIDAARLKNNPLNNTQYTQKVFEQMKSGDYHAFPKEVDNFAGIGTKTSIVGADNITRIKIELPGSYAGKKGHFEWIIEPTGGVNHRLFVPDR